MEVLSFGFWVLGFECRSDIDGANTQNAKLKTQNSKLKTSVRGWAKQIEWRASHPLNRIPENIGLGLSL
jgi:hypothetical protein